MNEHWGQPTRVRPTDTPPPTPEQIALYRIWQHSRHVVVALGADWDETFHHANAIDALAYEALGDAFEYVRDYVNALEPSDPEP